MKEKNGIFWNRLIDIIIFAHYSERESTKVHVLAGYNNASPRGANLQKMAANESHIFSQDSRTNLTRAYGLMPLPLPPIHLLRSLALSHTRHTPLLSLLPLPHASWRPAFITRRGHTADPSTPRLLDPLAPSSRSARSRLTPAPRPARYEPAAPALPASPSFPLPVCRSGSSSSLLIGLIGWWFSAPLCYGVR